MTINYQHIITLLSCCLIWASATLSLQASRAMASFGNSSTVYKISNDSIRNTTKDTTKTTSPEGDETGNGFYSFKNFAPFETLNPYHIIMIGFSTGIEELNIPERTFLPVPAFFFSFSCSK